MLLGEGSVEADVMEGGEEGVIWDSCNWGWEMEENGVGVAIDSSRTEALRLSAIFAKCERVCVRSLE